jgi:hypothetical protein
MSVKQMKPFMMNVILNRENKPSDVSCGILFYCLIKFNQTILILSRFVTINIFRLLHLTEVPLPLCGPAMLHHEEVSSPKTINIRQYLSTRHFLVLLSDQIQSDNINFIKICYDKYFFLCNHDN